MAGPAARGRFRRVAVEVVDLVFGRLIVEQVEAPVLTTW